MGNDAKPIAVGPGAGVTAVVDGPQITVSLNMMFLCQGSHWANQPIEGATVEVKGGSPKATSSTLGFAVLKLAAANLGKITLLISQIEAESSAALAGPSLAQAQNPAPWLFRSFEVDLEIDQNGIVDKSVPVARLTVAPDGPPYALVYKSSKKLLELDWRPDFLRAFTRRPRAAKKDVSCLVLHHTGGATTGSALNTFIVAADRSGKKSKSSTKVYGTPAGQEGKLGAHYVVVPDGHVIKLGHETEVMDHAGPSIWQGEKAVNSHGVGIEIVHVNHTTGYQSIGKTLFDDEGFPAAQMKSVARLVKEISAAYTGITRHRVVGHGDIAVKSASNFVLGRKGFEPDIHFDWKALEDLGYCRKPVDLPAPTPPLYGLAGPGKRHTSGGTKAGPYILELKKDLFEIGYSVSPKEITASTQLTDDTYDDALAWAVQAFEFRYLSGSRAKDCTWPRGGHLYWETAVLIKRVLADSGA
jgi:N-acetyl-anhydromuramyl-L-alanine amidase AmpD